MRETVAVLKAADMAPLDVTGYGTLAERGEVSDDERALDGARRRGSRKRGGGRPRSRRASMSASAVSGWPGGGCRRGGVGSNPRIIALRLGSATLAAARWRRVPACCGAGRSRDSGAAVRAPRAGTPGPPASRAGRRSAP